MKSKYPLNTRFGDRCPAGDRGVQNDPWVPYDDRSLLFYRGSLALCSDVQGPSSAGQSRCIIPVLHKTYLGPWVSLLSWRAIPSREAL